MGTSAMRAAWPYGPSQSQVVTIPLKASTDGARITVRKEAEEAFRLVDEVMVAHGYKVKRAETGSYVKRAITGGKGSSLHSHAIAVDFNWNSGPFRKRGSARTCEQLHQAGLTDWPCAMVADILAISTVDGEPIFRWGGTWQSDTSPASTSSRYSDAMHLELAVTPAQLADGIVPRGDKTGLAEWWTDVADDLTPDERAWLVDFAKYSHKVGVRPSSIGWIVERYRRAGKAGTFEAFRKAFFTK